MGVPVQENEVYIHDTYFPILGPVRRVNFAVTPNPVLFGDTTKASDSVAMTQLTQVDYNGGSGVHLGNTRTDTNRCWTSELATYHHRALHLPEFVEDLGVPGWAGATSDPRTVTDFNGKLWVSFDDKIGTWTAGGTGWAGAADHTCTGKVLRTAVWKGDLYLAEWNSFPEKRTTSGVWTSITALATSYSDLAVWDNKLWAISGNQSPAVLYNTLDGVNWTAIAVLPSFTSFYTDVGYYRLAVYRDSTGASALYVHTDRGLYIYDPTFVRFLPTEVTYSPASSMEDWFEQAQGPDGRLYATNGKLGVIAIQTGNPLVITPVGLDRDDGYPAAEDGAVVGMAADENFVYMLQHSTTNTKTILRGYRGGWHKFWSGVGRTFNSGGTLNIAQPIIVTTYSDGKAVYFTGKNGNAPKVYRMMVPTGVYNPRFFTAPAGYQAGPLTLTTPWWPFESEVQRKIFGHLFVQAKNHTASETTKIEYATDLDESTWTLVTGAYGDANPITSDGLKEFFAAIAGAQARWIRWRFTQQRGGAVTLTPIIEYYTAEMMRVLGPTYAYSVEVDLSKPWRKKTPSALRLRIEQLLDPGVVAGFYKFSWQDELEGVRTHYGRLSREAGMGYTGPGMRGQGRETLSIIIPYHRDVS